MVIYYLRNVLLSRYPNGALLAELVTTSTLVENQYDRRGGEHISYYMVACYVSYSICH